MEISDYKLIAFDLDDTLMERDTTNLLPGVKEWFNKWLDELDGKTSFAICTNQGGVGLRHWMESGGFGEPEKYPTPYDVSKRLRIVYEILTNIEVDDNPSAYLPLGIFKCYAYITKKGVVAPVPQGKELDPEWNPYCRKPYAGMLKRAQAYFSVGDGLVLFVGDRPEDEEAAMNAGCDFMWAWEFFGRDEPDE